MRPPSSSYLFLKAFPRRRTSPTSKSKAVFQPESISPCEIPAPASRNKYAPDWPPQQVARRLAGVRARVASHGGWPIEEWRR